MKLISGLTQDAGIAMRVLSFNFKAVYMQYISRLYNILLCTLHNHKITLLQSVISRLAHIFDIS